MKILIVHGPNLNLLGKREPDKYGNKTIEDINKELEKKTKNLKVNIEIFQSNQEGEIVDKIQQASGDFEGIVINPAAYTHTSVAIRDAILGVGIPCVEVHLSNIYAREQFRHRSFVSGVCVGQISGFREDSYILGLKAIIRHLSK